MSSQDISGEGQLFVITSPHRMNVRGLHPCSVAVTECNAPNQLWRMVIQEEAQEEVEEEEIDPIVVDITPHHVWFTDNPQRFLVRQDINPASPGPTYMVLIRTKSVADAVQRALTTAAPSRPPSDAPSTSGGANTTLSSSIFQRKTDKGSADLYFHYYGMLQHQQNMLQDYVRTGTYCAAILDNKADFAGKAVCDVGAGSGILSLFVAQAGARVVYAVEASNMAQYAAQLAAANKQGDVVHVVRGKVEEIDLPEKVDILVSEPMGTLLVNERMLETYLYARDRFLKPGGRMFPQVGRIHVAAFSDDMLYHELLAKSTFWQQTNFFGVDLTCLHRAAQQGYMSQVVVDAIHPSVICSTFHTHSVDFRTVTEKDLYDIVMNLQLKLHAQGQPEGTPVMIHGVACWFDVQFEGSTAEHWLMTGPGLPTTHWFQLRCVLEQPLVARTGATVTGELRLQAHERQSYDVHLTLSVPPVAQGLPPQQSSGVFDLKEPYYRQLNAPWYNAATTQ